MADPDKHECIYADDGGAASHAAGGPPPLADPFIDFESAGEVGVKIVDRCGELVIHAKVNEELCDEGWEE